MKKIYDVTKVIVREGIDEYHLVGCFRNGEKYTIAVFDETCEGIADEVAEMITNLNVDSNTCIGINRDLGSELEELGLTKDNAKKVIKWVDKLPIYCTKRDVKVSIINGLINISPDNCITGDDFRIGDIQVFNTK